MLVVSYQSSPREINCAEGQQAMLKRAIRFIPAHKRGYSRSMCAKPLSPRWINGFWGRGGEERSREYVSATGFRRRQAACAWPTCDR